jgi:hypothetical protein
MKFKITRIIEIEPVKDTTFDQVVAICQNNDQLDLESLHEFETETGDVIEFSINNVNTKVETIK